MFGLMRKNGNREREWPEYPLARARNEFETLFERFLAPWAPYVEPERFWKTELVEMEKELVMRAEVPGFEPEEFHVEVLSNELIIKAEHKKEEKKVEKEEKKSEYEYVERRYERTFTLPMEINLEKVMARYHNGVLEVHLPKTESTPPRRIEVRA
jgi:HSP20 family protein